MSLDKVLKITTEKAFKDREQQKHFIQSVKNVVGEDYRVLIMSEGMDIEPLEGSYYGIRTDDDGWLLNQNREIIHYPLRCIAEEHAKSIDGARVMSFNSSEEITTRQMERVKKEFKDRYTP